MKACQVLYDAVDTQQAGLDLLKELADLRHVNAQLRGQLACAPAPQPAE